MHDLIDENVDTANAILKEYFNNCRERLCDVLFRSCLSVYSRDLALHLLSNMQLNTQDTFARAQLLQDLDRVDLAFTDLQSLNPEQLADTNISQFLVNRKLSPKDDEYELTSWKLIRLCNPWTMLEIASRLTQYLTLERVFKLLIANAELESKLHHQFDKVDDKYCTDSVLINSF